MPDPSRFCASCGAALQQTGSAAATVALPESGGSSGPASSSASSLDEGRFPAGTILANRYRVIGLLGRGGMGEVYRANDLKLGQPVALKFLAESTAGNARMLARFQAEVRIARQVSHPNVCRVYDIGELEGYPYISMEYVDGEDLDSLLHRIGRLSGDKAIEMARSLCAGLTAAHDKGVLHRDLKPANIMIDARGQVLIMDFGLAGLAGQVEDGEIRSGTPLYMAPEQLAGTEVSVRSDIYSLGLVLYEMFTGKRAFDDPARRSTPASASSLVKDIDPAVDRLIHRCLSQEPGLRPPSARAVAAALPGGDQLSAALAAGVTPSPEMVAAAGSQEGIPVRSAVIYFAVMLAGLVLSAILGGKTSIVQKSPLEYSTEALAQKARDLAQTLGYRDRPTDHAYGFYYNTDFQRYAEMREPAAVFQAQLAQGQPPLINFWYRQSPQYLQAVSGDALVSASDPAPTVSGMVAVNLDSGGRLIYFGAVPPQMETTQEAGATHGGWNALFAAAGLDPAAFSPAQPQWLPLYSFDARAAWTGRYPQAPDIPMRIEAASWRGRPVSFQVISPWTRAARMQPYQATAGEVAGQWLYLVVVFALFVIATLLAWRHFGLGRGDARGASRLAGFVLCCALLNWLCEAHHVPTTQEYRSFTWALSSALFLAGAYWVLYVALEPYVRRRWPQSLISWSRLLGGGVRDPMVGGHLLIGCSLGVWFSIFFFVEYMFLEHYGSIPQMVRLDALTDARRTTGVFAYFLHQSIGIALTLFFLFFLLRALLNRQWLAAAVFILLFAGNTMLQSNHPVVSGAFTAMQGGLAIYTLIRFGVLPMVVGIFVSSLLPEFPVTSDFSNWYAGSNIFALVTVVVLGGWSLHTTLAGRPLFREGFLDS
ncbi:MAG TPA: serine/threonine-protein kinase [Bryobacteraceae bacterium]|nr:serine/threonine-protein kinase [Bryobacteraceae bacterium]